MHHEHAAWRLVDGYPREHEAALLVEGSEAIAELRELLTNSLVALVHLARKAGAHEVASVAATAALTIAGVQLPLIALADGGDA